MLADTLPSTERSLVDTEQIRLKSRSSKIQASKSHIHSTRDIYRSCQRMAHNSWLRLLGRFTQGMFARTSLLCLLCQQQARVKQRLVDRSHIGLDCCHIVRMGRHMADRHCSRPSDNQPDTRRSKLIHEDLVQDRRRCTSLPLRHKSGTGTDIRW